MWRREGRQGRKAFGRSSVTARLAPPPDRGQSAHECCMHVRPTPLIKSNFTRQRVLLVTDRGRSIYVFGLLAVDGGACQEEDKAVGARLSHAVTGAQRFASTELSASCSLPQALLSL